MLRLRWWAMVLVVGVLVTLPLVSASGREVATANRARVEVAARTPQADPPAVWTRSYNNMRTGANLQETTLTPENVQGETFGKLFSWQIDGQAYAQPLYVPNLDIPGVGRRNVIFIATQKNNVYAFDADDPAADEPFWQIQLGDYGVSADREFGTRYNGGVYQDIKPYVGITGSPVIDLQTNTLYVAPFIKRAPLQYEHHLVALDIRTGEQRPNSPQVITASIEADGAGSVNGVITFDSRFELQRAALLLHDGVVYVAFAGYADTNPYHGWLLGYDAQSLEQVSAFNTTPDRLDPNDENDGEGGIWLGGNGVSTDGTYLYTVVANGNWNADVGRNYGSSAIRLDPTNGLTVTTWFTPYDYDDLNADDTDLGTTAAVLIPDTNLMVFGSKAGKIYLVNRDDMGGLGVEDPANPGFDTPIPGKFYQSFKVHNPSNGFGSIYGTPVFWDGDTLGKRLYAWPKDGALKAYELEGTQFNTTAVATSTAKNIVWPGAILSLSAASDDPASGIVWASHALEGSANTTTRPGRVRAYRADTLEQLWHSDQNAARDGVGNFAKFNPPMVVNGKVYISDFSVTGDTNTDEIHVYGLLAPAIIEQPADVMIESGARATLSVRATGAEQLTYQWYRGAVGDTANPINGATESTFTTGQLTQNRMFWVRISNQYGEVDSRSVLVSIGTQQYLPVLRR